MRFWISFAAGKALGICLTEADSPASALEKLTASGQNPGGEALVIEMTRGDLAQDVEWNRFEKDRLYSEQEIKAVDSGYKPINELNSQQFNNANLRLSNSPHVHRICKECNE